MVWSVPRIARATGVDPVAALWLGVLNPLVLIHLVADAHNDALMLGLMMAGLALALERRPAVGAVLVTLAALVKAPAGAGPGLHRADLGRPDVAARPAGRGPRSAPAAWGSARSW